MICISNFLDSRLKFWKTLNAVYTSIAMKLVAGLRNLLFYFGINVICFYTAVSCQN